MGKLYRQRRAGAVVLHGNGGVLPGLSDKTNGLPTDDMNVGGHPDKVLPREASLGPAGEETVTAERSLEQQREHRRGRGDECGSAQQRVLQGEDEVGEHE